MSISKKRNYLKWHVEKKCFHKKEFKIFANGGRAEIWTRGLFLAKEARFQAAPHAH